MVVVGVGIVVSCCVTRGVARNVDPASVKEMEIITAGVGVEFGRTACGQLTFLAGRPCTNPRKGLLPVHDAVFWYAPKDGSQRTELAVAVNADGTLETELTDGNVSSSECRGNAEASNGD